jgi:hypothetical protein
LRTGFAHASGGIASTAAANRAADAVRSAICSASGRPAPAAISSARRSTLGYIGVSTPVRAHVSRFTYESALRAIWVSTCPQVQPGSSDGAEISRPEAVASRRSSARVTSVANSIGSAVTARTYRVGR